MDGITLPLVHLGL
jgi:hypothetical protein